MERGGRQSESFTWSSILGKSNSDTGSLLALGNSVVIKYISNTFGCQGVKRVLCWCSWVASGTHPPSVPPPKMHSSVSSPVSDWAVTSNALTCKQSVLLCFARK